MFYQLHLGKYRQHLRFNHFNRSGVSDCTKGLHDSTKIEFHCDISILDCAIVSGPAYVSIQRSGHRIRLPSLILDEARVRRHEAGKNNRSQVCIVRSRESQVTRPLTIDYDMQGESLRDRMR